MISNKNIHDLLLNQRVKITGRELAWDVVGIVTIALGIYLIVNLSSI